MEKVDVLRQIPIFSKLGDEELKTISDTAIRKKYSKESIIVHEEDEGNSLMFILSGRVKVVLLSEGGKEIILSILGDGDFFGEMSLLDGEPRSATVIAMKDSTMLVIQRNDFLKQLKQNPTIATGVLSEMSRRIRRADQRIGNLILLDVFGRVARFLLDLAKREGVRYDDGILIERRPTQQDIASMIGASRETVSRVLNELNRRGLISISGKSVMIYGPEDIIEDDGELRFPSEKVEV